MRAAVAALLILLLSSVASLAQSPVSVIGAVTPGHCASFFSTTQIQDAGACGGGGGGAVASIGNAAADTSLTIAGTGTGPWTGAVTVGVNVANAFVWTNLHTYIGAGSRLLLSNNAAATALTNQGVDLTEDGAPASITQTTYGIAGTTNMPTFVGQTARGSLATPAAVQANDVLASFSGRGYTGSGFATAGRGFVRFFASETWSGTANGAYISFATTPNTTLATAEAVRIENDGGVMVPPTVTGGSKGAGTINAGAFYIGGAQLALPVSLTNGGTNNALTASAGGIVWSDATKLNILAGTSTAGQCLLSGNLVTPSWGACPQTVSAVSNADGTLTISPTTGAVVASLALGHANSWTAAQTFAASGIKLLGSSTGATTFTSANASASNFTLTVPAATDQLVARATTDTLTNKTYDTAGTGNIFKINGTTITAISGNTGTVGTTSGAFVSGNCVKTDANHNLVDNAAVCGGGGTPGGANTNVQFNNSGAFGGDAGFTYAGNGQVTHALGTITTNLSALNITGTWNAVGTTFDAPLEINITNTASAAASSLFDFAVGANSLLILQPNTNSRLSLAGGATASAFRVYNTVDTLSGPTNYERGVFDWTTSANQLWIGVQAGGTGSIRKLIIDASNQVTTATGLLVLATGSNGSVLFSSQTASTAGASAMAVAGTNIGNGGLVAVATNAEIGFATSQILNTNPTPAMDVGIGRTAAKVLQINDGSQGNSNGWMQWAGAKRVTSDFSVTSSTALVNITGLTVNVIAGRTYTFQCELYVTDAAAGGVQAAIAGTATATAINYTGFTIADNATKGKTNATALGTAVGSTTTTETTGIIVRIAGTITVNAAGTLTVQMAQNTSNGTATIAKQGSWFIVNDMP